MWIAKPLGALQVSEREAWRQARASDAPLSQDLRWGEAIQRLGAPVYLAMSPDEGVGGLVHESSPGIFECTNGPLLDWDEPSSAPRQLATFAMAVSKLSPRFRGLTFRPRWEASMLEGRLRGLPVQPESVSRAQTIQIPVEPSREAQLERASPRLRRTLAATGRAEVACTWQKPDPVSLAGFAHEMRRYGAERDFFVPPDPWFEALSCGFELGLATARAGERESRLLVCLDADRAYYLFGVDRGRASGASALSTAACAQFRALDECRALGATIYDLQGYVGASGHPYAGVSRFKEQFGGRVVDYACPEFRVE